MHILTFLLALAALGLIGGACAVGSDFANLRSKTEDLGETLYMIGSWMDPWLNIVPKETYPEGAGYDRSVFTIERSEPTSDEPQWKYIQSLKDATYGALDQDADYQTAQVGHKENHYKPERLPLVGPLVGQDDLVMYWHSKDFWMKYFKALEMYSIRQVSNRIANMYMRFIPKYSCNSSLTSAAGVITPGSGANAPTGPDLSGLAGPNVPNSGLTQEFLDTGAADLIREGAYDPNTQGWLTLGPDGPIFPLLIGLEASRDLLLNNSEFRSDLNQSFQGWGDTNPVIQRMGASRVIKNFRHMVTPFPPRWGYNAGAQIAIGGKVLATDRAGNTTLTNAVAIPAQSFYRIPVWSMSSDPGDVTAGQAAVINPIWENPSTAPYEAAVSMHPMVCTEEVLKPVNSAPGMKWNPKNYFGEWQFITGNDALIGFSGCTGVADPTHSLGRHFAYYRHAIKPVLPQHGRMWLFSRCAAAYETVTCS